VTSLVPPRQRIEQGRRIGSHYRVVAPLGAGTGGQVLLARDEMLQRDVAIKILQPDMPVTNRARSRFLTEARAMARVHHQNVLAVYGVGQHEELPYMVTEYVDGCNLEVWLETRPNPSFREAFHILRQICLGVAAIHRAATVHRDLKPSNILISAGFRVVVADLGLARFLDTSGGDQVAMGVVGTPTHMSPETIVGSIEPGLAEASDVYSLGVMAFQILTGELPFSNENAPRLMIRHLTQQPPKPSSVRPELSTYFDEVILTALDKSPSKRRTVAGFLEGLEEARLAMDGPPTLRSIRACVTR